ncbi:hypothetical protein CD790_21865 [Streptomyces sp. SAJ15]|nr:hypothetical protein CD790_21865 [Streptomyces sp. SAJ15]
MTHERWSADRRGTDSERGAGFGRGADSGWERARGRGGDVERGREGGRGSGAAAVTPLDAGRGRERSAAGAGARARGGERRTAGGAGDRLPARSGRGGSGRTGEPGVLFVRFHPTGDEAALGADTYQALLGLLAGVTPIVEALPPDAALVDVSGALRYFGRDAIGLAGIVRVRALARYGVDCTIGVAANPLLARMAAADGPRGAIRAVPADPDAVAAFLAPKPAAALHGVGPATARALGAYGLDSVERIAATPLPTLQRILGAAAGRRVYEGAHGVDPAQVTPNAPARAMALEHRFELDELDPVRRRRALLALTHRLGAAMRRERQAATALTLTVRYADRSTTTRGHTLPEPTAHTPALTAAAYRLHEALGLQRARVRSLALRADLTDARRAVQQLTFDPLDARRRRVEAAMDRAEARYGTGAVGPAATYRRRSALAAAEGVALLARRPHVQVPAHDGQPPSPGGARLPEVRVAVLDDEDAVAVRLRVLRALVVAAALLHDGEVEADRGAFGQQLGGVLLTDRQPGPVRPGGQQPGEGDVVVLVEPAVGALVGVEVVGLQGLVPAARAAVDPPADDRGQLGPLGRGRDVEERLVPVLVDDQLPVGVA